jgi:hypothetical protein
MNKKLIYLSILAIGALFFSKNALAEADQISKGFSVSPFFQELSVQEKDDKIPFTIEIKNNNELVTVFRISVLDFGALDESGGVAFLGSSDNLKYGLASWIILENDTVVIAPGETQTVKGSIENRDSLSPGGHYAAVYFKMEENENSVKDNKNVALDTSFASLLFVRKIGGEIYGLNLNNVDFPFSIFKLPASVGLRFQNPGNVHVLPRGTIELTDPFGRKIQRGIINEQSAIILPETFRVFKTEMLKLTTAFVPGEYKLDVFYRFDGKTDFTRKNQSFFFVPPLFIGSVVSLLILIAGVISFIKKKNKKKLNVSR